VAHAGGNRDGLIGQLDAAVEIKLGGAAQRVGSGLIDAAAVLQGVRGIAFSHFSSADVVRHPLVARIVEAYDAAGGARKKP
jgi:hypothetical protein